jgi:hypothetical protein
MRLVDTLCVGQPMILWADLKDKIPYDVEITDFSNLSAGQFVSRYGESMKQLVANIQLPVWIAARRSNKRGSNEYWKIANPNGETKVIGYGDIFCLATIGHGTHHFERWVVLEGEWDKEGGAKVDGVASMSIGKLRDSPFTFQDTLSERWFKFRIHRSNFVVQMLPYGGNTGTRGIVSLNDTQFVMNMGHLNQYNAKFYKSKYGMGYLVSSNKKPEYSISKRLNAIAYEHADNDWPKSIQREENEAQVFYVPLSYFQPYAVPDGTLEQKTLHILNWVATGCDELIHTNL